MAKLKRCEAGHVFDSEAHRLCPDCVRLGIIRDASESAPDAKPAGGDAGAGKARSVAIAGAIAIPVSWLAGGGAAAAVALTVGFIVLRPAPAPVAQPSKPPAKEATLTPGAIPPPADILPPKTMPAPADILPSAPPPQPQPSLVTPILPLPGSQPEPPKLAPNIAPGNLPVPMFDPSMITPNKIGATHSGWGSLAFNPRTRGYGESWGYGNADQAKRRALDECSGDGCQSAVWYRRRCGAIAADRNGKWASGLADTVELAVRDAFIDCARNGGTSCELIRVNCTR